MHLQNRTRKQWRQRHPQAPFRPDPQRSKAFRHERTDHDAITAWLA